MNCMEHQELEPHRSFRVLVSFSRLLLLSTASFTAEFCEVPSAGNCLNVQADAHLDCQYMVAACC